MEDTITFVIPTFNRSAMLRRSLASVLEEQRVPIKVLILDNASTDDTPAVVAALAAQDLRISYSRNEVNLGSVGNYTKGLATVTTRYFIPLADDDYVLPGFVHEAYGIMQRDRTLGAVIFSTEQRNIAGEVTARYPSSPEHVHFGRLCITQHLRQWMTYGHYAWSSVLWNADVLRRVGFPYLHIGLPSDVDFQAQIFCSFPVFLVDKPGAVFSEHPGQASGQFSIAQLRSWADFFDRLDKSAGEAKVFDAAEYARLRAIMWERFRGIWNIFPTVMPPAAEIAKAASVASTRLGDEELASRLLDHARLHGGAEAAEAAATVTIDEPVAEPPSGYASRGEDIVLWRALGAVEKGYYVDIGAGDPTRHSVTKVFYDHGWCGVNVERARGRQEALVRERTRDLSLHLVIVGKYGPEPILADEPAGLGDTQASGDGPTATIMQLLASLPIRDIHFLRLGLEGKSTALLEGIDLWGVRPWILLVRAPGPGEGPEAAWEQAVRKAGYLRALSDGHNQFFIAEQHRELLPVRDVPAEEAISVAESVAMLEAPSAPLLSGFARSMIGCIQLFVWPALRRVTRCMIRLGA